MGGGGGVGATPVSLGDPTEYISQHLYLKDGAY